MLLYSHISNQHAQRHTLQNHRKDNSKINTQNKKMCFSCTFQMEILCPEEYHRLKVNFGSPKLKSFKITAHKQLEINVYTEVKATVIYL